VNTPIVRLGINPRAASRRGLSRLVLPAVAATMLIGSVAPAFSAVGIEIEVAPPPARVIVAPPPRPGYVWAPGYYRWDGHRHVWVDGHFIHERRGSHWVPERWDERHGHYRFVPGHWEHG
jgi:WXXGXW repeat (2 copies)